jgi:DNA invertase Pin-like site-specific DNA recombinase
MPSTTHVLDEARDLVKKRLAELDDERRRLERALHELGEKATSGVRRAGRRRGRPKGSGKATGAKKGKRKAGTRRRKRSGTRADQAVKLVQSKPGISASEIAKQMKIKPNYLYRVLGELEKEGRVKKKGRSYSAK